jgi:hypothetical protein
VVTARAVTTLTGRTRYDLFLSGREPTGLRVVGFASSWDGLAFSVAAQPMLAAKPPDVWAPTVTAYRAGSLLLFTQGAGAHTLIEGAHDP